MPSEPQIGAPAPDFDLPSSAGGALSLKSLRGKVVVLYFYPKDDTPGCTVEACEFGKSHGGFEKAGAVVLGVSPDGLESHAKFISKFGLPFVLLSDEDHACANAYGVWVKKSMYGKEYMGVQRATFLLDGKGVLRKSWPKVKAEGHAAEVLESIRELGEAMRVGIFDYMDCAHSVKSLDGCDVAHGHTYKVEVVVSGAIKDGMILDFKALRATAREAMAKYDHKDLSVLLDPPTCENLAQALFRDLKRALPGLERVRCWEGHNKWAEAQAEDGL